MHILFVNKYLYPKGGSETHLLGAADLLSRRGHDIQFFGTDHPDNVTPPNQTVTIPSASYTELVHWRERFRAFRDMLFSHQAYRRLQEYLTAARPALAHLHNIYHQLSPSVLVALKRAGVPTLLTAHDYKLVCPSYSLHDGSDQCFKCRGHHYWNVVRYGCSRKGTAGDAALALEAYLHHFLRIYHKNLDLIIAPSRFVRDRLVDGGYSPGQIQVLPNAVAVADFQARPEPGDYMLFVGRLSYEKGLPTLIAAARLVPHIPIWIAGDGPLRAELERQAVDLPQVRFLGRQSATQVSQLLRACRSLILPSAVPENCPLSVLEAFASAKPVIASNVGGIPELFAGPPAGLLVPPNDPASLAAAINQFWEDSDLSWHCGNQARIRAESMHDLNDYINRLEAIYQSLSDRQNTRQAVAAVGTEGFSAQHSSANQEDGPCELQ